MDRMYVRWVNLMIKWLFLEDSSLLCYSNSLSIFLHYFSDPPFMEGLSHYIEFSKPFPSYTCLSSNPALKYVSYQASSLTLWNGSGWEHCSEVFSTLMQLGKLLQCIECGGGSFSLRYFCIFIVSVRAWSLSSLLESSERLPKSPECLLDWYSSGPRRMTFSDLDLLLFPNATIYCGTSLVICSSSDAFPLVNGA